MDEELLKRELETQTLKPYGGGGGGCISSGQGYETDHGRVFVKVNSESEVRITKQQHVLCLYYASMLSWANSLISLSMGGLMV